MNKNIQAGATTMKVEGNDAKAVVSMTFPSLGCGGDLTFKLRQDSDEWLIRHFSIDNLKKF